MQSYDITPDPVLPPLVPTLCTLDVDSQHTDKASALLEIFHRQKVTDSNGYLMYPCVRTSYFDHPLNSDFIANIVSQYNPAKDTLKQLTSLYGADKYHEITAPREWLALYEILSQYQHQLVPPPQPLAAPLAAPVLPVSDDTLAAIAQITSTRRRRPTF